jgi:WD40 repeat protein
MDEKKRSIDQIKPLAETEALSRMAKHTGNEGEYEEETDDSFVRAPSNSADDASSMNRLTVKAGHSSAASTSCNPPTAEEIAAILQSSPEAFFHQLASTFLETGVDGEELMQFLQSKSKWLPVSVIVEHILPFLDRVSQNRLCSTYKELHAASLKDHTPWPFKRRLHAVGRAYVYSVAFSPDSELLVGGGDDTIIRIWDRTGGRCTQLGGDVCVNSLCFSPDGNLLASASDDPTIRLWKLEDLSFRVLEGHGSGVLAVAFSRDGSTLVSGDYNGNIHLWDVNDGTCIRELVDDSFDVILSLAFAPDGVTIASTGYRMDEEDEELGGIVIWDISDTDDISSTTVVDTYDGAVNSLEYSPDGRYFASGAENGTVRLWNAVDSSYAVVMAGNNATVYSVAFSPNGKIMASASTDGSVRLWGVEDGDCSCLVNLLGHHEGGASFVSFSPDGQTLASSGGDGTVRLWNPHEEDRKQFKQVDWETVFSLWNFQKE